MTRDATFARRVAVGTAANVVGQGFVVITRIVLAPVILGAVGARDFGLWVVVGTVASFGFMLELGISAALVKYVAEYASRREVDEAGRTAAAATSMYAVLGGVVFVVALGLGMVLPIAFGLEASTTTVVRWLAVLAGLDVAIAMVAIVPVAVFKGLQRFPAVNALTIIGSVISAVATILVVRQGGGIVGVAAVGAGTSMCMYMVSLLAVRRTAPGYLDVVALWDGERARRLFRFSRSIALTQVAVRLQTRLDALVIAAALPVQLVTPYNFAQRLADGTRIATDQFGKVLLPLASEIRVTRNSQALRALYLTATRLTLAIAFGVGLPVALLGSTILELWVGQEFARYGVLVTVLTLAAIVDLPSYPAAAVLQSIERHGRLAFIAIASGVANLALSIVLVRTHGVEGVAFATLVASGIEIVGFVLPFAAKVLDVSWRDLAGQVLARLVVPIGALAALLFLMRAVVPPTSLPRLAVVVAVPLAGYAAAYAFVGAAPTEREAYRSAAGTVGRIARRSAGGRG